MCEYPSDNLVAKCECSRHRVTVSVHVSVRLARYQCITNLENQRRSDIIWVVFSWEDLKILHADHKHPHIVALLNFVLQKVDQKLCWILQAFQPILCKGPHRNVTWRVTSRMHAAR